MFDPRDFGADYQRFLGGFYDWLNAQSAPADAILGDFAEAFAAIPQPQPSGPSVLRFRSRIAPSDGAVADFAVLPKAARITGPHAAHVEGVVPEGDYSVTIRAGEADIGTVEFPAGGRVGAVTVAEGEHPAGTVVRIVGGPVDQAITHFGIALCTSST